MSICEFFFLFMRIDIRHESTYINKHTGGKGTCTTCRVVDPVALTPARRVPKGLWGTSWYHLTGQVNLTKGLKGDSALMHKSKKNNK